MPLPSAPTGLSVSLASPTSGAKPLLQPGDFTYLGYYAVQTNGANTIYGEGLTHRYVGGDLRFLSLSFMGNAAPVATRFRLDEWSLAGKTYGQKVTATTGQWPSLGPTAPQPAFKGIWWEESTGRLWMTSATDYVSTQQKVFLTTRTLNANGTIGNLHGPVGLSGLPQKRVYGGVQAVPAWFRQQFSVGSYVCGWGGYTSLVAQSGIASLGLTGYTFPDIAAFTDNAEVPTGQWKTLTDHASGTAPSSGACYTALANHQPTPYDRTQRATFPAEEFDTWHSPTPDGKGRFTWGDSYYNTGCWIDGPTKQGFIGIASLGNGRCWYQNSTLNFDARQFELHVYDPAQFGQVLTGTRQPWQVQPSSLTEWILPGLGKSWGGDVTVKNVAGATYDPIGKRLYLLGMAANGGDPAIGPINRLYVYQVN